MAMHQHSDHFKLQTPDSRRMTNQPTSSADSASEEIMADADEPPDDIQDLTPKPLSMKLIPSPMTDTKFRKTAPACERKQSLLTQMIHTSESDSNAEEENLFSDVKRAHSIASTWSHGSLASTAELTSDGHTSPARTSTPSPPLPSTQFHGLPPLFNKPSFDGPRKVNLLPPPTIDPLEKPTAPNNEQAVEAGLGRKRCIAFACGLRKSEPTKTGAAEEQSKKPESSVKRPFALKFDCPSRDTSGAAKPASRPARLISPPPARRTPSSPSGPLRHHRGSDSTVRNESPKSVRKTPPMVRARRGSDEMEVERYEATRFHEFASSDEEVDDWTQESTCHQNRLTIKDTLKVENHLRQIADEAEEEAIAEEEDDEDQDLPENEDDDDEDENEEIDDAGVPNGYVSDEGFQTDDEEGFAGSDDESDAGSDYAWWAPARGTSAEPYEHIRPTSRRSQSDSSIGSFTSDHGLPTIKIPKSSRAKASVVKRKGHPLSPELPDSTDFVCGTLDEDRPLEDAYLNQLEQRRAAKHKKVPQDIDPTFPTSDPEMDEEDEDSEHDKIDDSDHHLLMHGHIDMHEDVDVDERQPRHHIIPRKRSPPHSPGKGRLLSPPPTKRVPHRSPPPTKRNVHRSPPPRKLFGQSPKRTRSPMPSAVPIHSPPPTRRASLTRSHKPPTGLASRPRLGLASSLPRNGHEFSRPGLHSEADDDDDTMTQTDALPPRGAIAIVMGLEKKRQRRKEKMYEKHCRNKKKAEKTMQPGKGAEKMREMGMELAAYRGKRPAQIWEAPASALGEDGHDPMHILSY